MSSYNTQRSQLCDSSHSPYASPIMTRSYAKVPYDELGYAIRWEQCRARYFHEKEQFFESRECQARARGYERRSVQESQELMA